MPSIKEKMIGVIQALPDDSTYDEILRELVFDQMIESGLEDSRLGRVISHGEMEQRMRSSPQRTG